jgi:O-acetyl-ADP-ribose deacetylase (regulator of RNase III)
MPLPPARLIVVHGDITHERVDVIVNAANGGLLGGGGVDGAIHRAGGKEILEACRQIRAHRGPLSAGEAVMTTAGRLHARFVVHAVGPVWQGGEAGEEGLLAAAYTSSLALALDAGCRTIAFPSISTGVYGFPVERAAPLALRTVRAFTRDHPGFEEIRFVTFSAGDEATYRRALEETEERGGSAA